jgi:hypothetical protein
MARDTGRPGSTDKHPRARPWLLPTVATVAVVIVVAAIVYTIATGQRFF